MQKASNEKLFDVFLSHSHHDAEWVESLATRLKEESNFNVWLDKWMLVPGRDWQPELSENLESTSCCAVCLGAQTPKGWFRQEIQKALNKQSQDPSFGVIPVLLPDADKKNADKYFLNLKTWVDFGPNSDPDYSFHLLSCGIKGVPPGRWDPNRSRNLGEPDLLKASLRKLKELKDLIDDDVRKEFQRELITQHIIRKL